MEELVQIEAEHQDLWDRIRQFRFDDPSATLTFSTRLARDNNWSRRYARRAIEEYRRFLLLAVAAGHQVTPSVAVDQVWHQHMTYTRSYWDNLCGNVLRAPLHHDPTEGGDRENEKFADWYHKTLESYERMFGTPPPSDIWPPSSIRFARSSTVLQVTRGTHWVIEKTRPMIVAGVVVCLLGGSAAAYRLILGHEPAHKILIVMAIIIGIGLLLVANGASRKFARKRARRLGYAGGIFGSCGTDGGGNTGWFGGNSSHGGGWDGGGGHGCGSSGCGSSGCGGGGCGGGGCGGGS